MTAKLIRTAALSRHQAPDFALIFGLELMQLRKLSWLARALFLELVAMADFATGRIETSYAVLMALVDFDQVPGAHADRKPTLQAVRTDLEALVSLGLVRVDRIANEKRKGLFFRLPARTSISASDGMSNRRSNRPQKAAKQATARVAAKSTPEEQQTEQQGVQQVILNPPTPLVVHSPKPSRTVLAMRSKVRGAG